MRPAFRSHFARWAGLCLIAVLACTGAARAELPVEQLTMEKMPPPDAYRLYVGDPAMPHLVDGRTHVLDGRTLRYLGMLGTGFAAQTALSRDGQFIYVATTYYTRLQRGTRADVVEVYRADDLSFQYEIEIPTKHVQGLNMRALLATTGDDKLLLVQNATPATSVTVVDLQARKVTAEVMTPGCYGVIPWPGEARRFSAVCGDGTLATFDLDPQGALASRSLLDKFFDPDKDPVFMQYEFVGKQLILISFRGVVHTLDLGAGAKPVAAPTWSLVSAADAKQGWRPGGYQFFAYEPKSERLYVGMHDRGAEGSHKSPAKEIWVIDLKTHQRVGRMPGHMALSMNIARADKPRLFLLDATDNRVVAFDLGAKGAPKKAAGRSEPVGDTPIYLGMP